MGRVLDRWPVLLAIDNKVVEGYHCGTLAGSIERRRVPQVRRWNLGLSFGAIGYEAGNMPSRLKRYYGKGDLHFVTFSCYHRMPLLKSARARGVFVRELARVRDEMGFRLVGYVVMPEHVHLLMSEPRDGTPSTVLHRLKLRVARRLRGRKKAAEGQLCLPFDGREKRPGAFWQARFYDFNVYSEAKKNEKLHYMHANPVKRRLVKRPQDWAWSSWSWYWGGKKGLIQIDPE
jgi:putative transposase